MYSKFTLFLVDREREEGLYAVMISRSNLHNYSNNSCDMIKTTVVKVMMIMIMMMIMMMMIVTA